MQRDEHETCLLRLEEFGTQTRETIETLCLTNPKIMTRSQKALWNSSTTTWPQVFPAEQCWKNKSPSSEDLILGTLDLISASKNAERRKKVDDYKVYIVLYSQGLADPVSDPRKAIAQLHEPDKSNPVALIGYRLPKLMSDENPGFITPVALTRFAEPFNEDNRQVLLTPKFWKTDLHIDNYDGLSTTIGTCEKLWIIFPPTPRNIQLIQLADGQRSKLERIGKELEGGLMIHTDSSEALYIPAGCIHAVYTLRGGFLITLEFTTPVSVKVLSTLLNAQFDRFKDQWLQSELPGQFIESVELALTQNQVQVGLDAWIDTQDRLHLWFHKDQDFHESTRNQYWMDRRAGWEKKVCDVWATFFRSSYSGSSLTCPCKRVTRGQTFKEHFYADHFVLVHAEHSTVGSKNICKRASKRRKMM